MQTVAQLKQNGYSVGPAPRAVGCTEVQSAEVFYFFNPRFLDDASLVADNLHAAAQLEDGRYGVIIAGTFADADEFPFVLLSIAQEAEVRAAHVAFTQARAQRDEATRRVGEAGTALAGLLNAMTA